MGKLQFVHTKALEAISKYLSTFSTTSIHTPVVVLSFFSRSFSFSSFLLKKKRTYIVKKKEKRVEKWITPGARSVVGDESRGGRLLDYNRGCCKKIKAVKADFCGKGQQKWIPQQVGTVCPRNPRHFMVRYKESGAGKCGKVAPRAAKELSLKERRKA